jgi:signal transduction histidine kinase
VPDARASLRDAIHDATAGCTQLAAERDVEVHVGEIPDLAVGCAPGVLASITTNLVTNAIVHMGASQERIVTVRASALDELARVEVDDTGPGVSEEAAASIFEAYVSLDKKSRGLGLGLATVKRLADAHGGAVGVRRKPRGATFWCELPRSGAS